MRPDPTEIPYGYCHCGCGDLAPIAKSTHRARGYVAGQPVRFRPGHNSRRDPGWLAEDRGYDTPCHIWQGVLDAWGYGRSPMRDRMRRPRAHRLAWTVVNGPIPGDLRVLHHCDQPACVNVEHLFLGTDADNMADMVAKGRQAKRARNGNARLTEADIAAIRAATGVAYPELAARFGVSRSHISDIRCGRAWSEPGVPIGRPGAILTLDKAREIRSSQESRRVLAQRYGVSESTIGNIKQGRNWPEAEEIAREEAA